MTNDELLTRAVTPGLLERCRTALAESYVTVWEFYAARAQAWEVLRQCRQSNEDEPPRPNTWHLNSLHCTNVLQRRTKA
jgi:hypothetical protein